MADQISLDGFDAPSEPTDRLFFALLPEAAARDRVASLTRRLRGDHGLVAKPIPAERLHVTLHHLGDYVGLPAHIVVAASDVAARLVVPSFVLGFDRVATFSGKPGRLPLVLRGDESLAGVMALQSALEMGLIKAGLVKGPRAAYTPHLTLLYGDRPVDERLIDPIAWSAREFVLVRSLMGRAQYTVIGRWPLPA
ncbi:2'-5' RNA ligase family protein [Aquabacterium sp.]|uniref:2'-5' RNA ligase family protein n=1 Tax=Aquabacterium sp. TaxID=1872578 RepID=UPI003D6D949C